ncbi:hypothetical protein OJ253_3713 [Cryptosporidium canis]|uniref:FecR family protein n=1 Tax=Cryptosporidium canis TaxID=195482 RepID=A0A9D5DJA5_9CRYT|nr:hypothetical protein OJ253_3713 [Cryptosporidium canis]
MADDRLAYLYKQYINKTCTVAELEEFFRYMANESHHGHLTALAEKHLIEVDKFHIEEIDWNSLYQQILRKGNIMTDAHEGNRVTPIYKRAAFRWIAAASIVLIAALAITLGPSKEQQQMPGVIKATTNDVEAPTETRAVITLADGSKIYLDSINNGTIAQQDNVTVVKNAEGAISYQLTGNGQQPIAYNILSNPRGSKVIDMQLSDGSHVWLNSGSSITYPVVFVGRERKITVDGEAYFEVAHNASKPFIVTKGETSVQVLGTHFNVNAYSDESDIKITLLEGSVRVNNGSANKLLKPGQQAQVDAGTVTVKKDADIEKAVAWKDGLFNFRNDRLRNIMPQIARWYDVDVIYENSDVQNIIITGEIERTANLSEVLKILTYLKIDYRIEGRKLILKG